MFLFGMMSFMFELTGSAGETLREKRARERSRSAMVDTERYAKEKVRQRWEGDKLPMLLPLIFVKQKKEFALGEEPSYEPTSNEPMQFDLAGGGILKLGSMETIDYAERKKLILAVGLTSHNSRGELVEHPLVIKGIIKDYESLERPLEKGEEKEILRLLALFNPDEIVLDSININDENRIIVLQTIGFDIFGKGVELLAEDGGQERLDDFFKLESLEEIPTLFDPNVLEEYFSSDGGKWVTVIYQYLALASAPISISLKIFESMFYNPISKDTVTAEEFEQVIKFIDNHGLAKFIDDENGKRISAHPLIRDKIQQLEADLE